TAIAPSRNLLDGQAIVDAESADGLPDDLAWTALGGALSRGLECKLAIVAVRIGLVRFMPL
ncbi:MAG TPA: hypothetical protein VHU84_16945, partial [Lacipirellulaceae bacterium]|nr:hypothetical protein [Lacipirellulaceae bacterium]